MVTIARRFDHFVQLLLVDLATRPKQFDERRFVYSPQVLLIMFAHTNILAPPRGGNLRAPADRLLAEDKSLSPASHG